MGKFLLAYRGGGMPEGEAEVAKVMEAWGAWFASIGDAVVDPGDPCFTSRTIAADGSVGSAAPASVSGYTILAASDLDAAVELARGCPVRAAGASIEVIEIVPAM